VVELNNLTTPKGSRKRKKRVGRGPGSGLGTYSGRGVKGENSRSGGGVSPGFEGGQTPFIKRIPKKGFNRKKSQGYSVVNIRELNRFKKGAEVTIEKLREEGLVKGKGPVKILGDGEIDFKLTVHAHKFSKVAREKIEGAGGKAIENV